MEQEIVNAAAFPFIFIYPSSNTVQTLMMEGQHC